jgi:hypothetical protein
MKTQTFRLLLIAALCMLFGLFGRHFFAIPGDVMDFLKAFGGTLLVGALFIEKLTGKEHIFRGKKHFQLSCCPPVCSSWQLPLSSPILPISPTSLPGFCMVLLLG